MQSHVIPVTIKTSEIHCIPCGLFRSNVFISRWPQVSVLLSVFHIQKWIISNLTHFISQPRRVQSHKQHINRLWWCSRARELFLQWHSTWTPSQIHFGRFWIEGNKAECSTAFFFFVVKTWPTGERSSGKKKKIQPPLRGREWEWASARPHLRWWMRPQVNESDMLHLSIPLCHNESLCTGGNKTTLSDTRKCITRSNRK